MNETLRDVLERLSTFGSIDQQEIGIGSFLFLALLSLACAFFISYLYLLFYSSRETGSQIHRSFPLLGLSITAIFICIQFSLPLSLGLLGALSIVRFRTPVKEPEEIGFVMLVIAASLACATFNLAFLGIILTVAVVGLLFRRYGPKAMADPLHDGVLTVCLPAHDFDDKSEALLGLLESSLARGRMESFSKTGDSVVLSFDFRELTPAALVAMQRRLQELVVAADVTVLFNRPGGL